MKLSRYRFIHWDTAPGIIIRNIKGLTYDQQKEITKFFDTGEYYLVETYEKKNENGLWRFTLPFFFLLTLFSCLIIQPLKWVFTGSYYFSARTKIYKFMDTWQKRLKI